VADESKARAAIERMSARIHSHYRELGKPKSVSEARDMAIGIARRADRQNADTAWRKPQAKAKSRKPTTQIVRSVARIKPSKKVVYSFGAGGKK